MVSFLPSYRSRQTRGPNFGSFSTPDTGAFSAAPAVVTGPSTPAPAPAAPAPFRREDSIGGEGYAGGGVNPATSGYGKTDNWTGLLGFPGIPQLAGMIAAPNASSIGAALFGDKPTSVSSRISDAFDDTVVDPNLAAPGKAASGADVGKSEYSGKGDVADPGLEGGGGSKASPGVGGEKGDSGGTTAGSPEADPGSPGGGVEGLSEGSKGEAQGGGDKARTGAFLPPPPGGPQAPQPVPITAHTGEFIMRPEIVQAIGPELLTAVNSGVIPPEVLAEAIQVLIEQYAPEYMDQDMPIAGPNGSMMPGGGMGGMGGGEPRAPSPDMPWMPSAGLGPQAQMETSGRPPPDQPGYRVGGAVRGHGPESAIHNLPSGPWDTEWLNPNDTMQAGMRMRERPPPPSALRRMAPEKAPETEKKRMPVPPYRPQFPPTPEYRMGGHVSALRHSNMRR